MRGLVKVAELKHYYLSGKQENKHLLKIEILHDLKPTSRPVSSIGFPCSSSREADPTLQMWHWMILFNQRTHQRTLETEIT